MKKLLVILSFFILAPSAFAVTTWNPSDKAASITLSNGNLTAAGSDSGRSWAAVRANVNPTSGKYYWEVRSDSDSDAPRLGDLLPGLLTGAESLTYGNYANTANGWSYYVGAGCYNSGAPSDSCATFAGTTGVVMNFAWDVGAGKFWTGKNGTWNNSGNPAAGTGYIWTGLATGLYPYFATDELSNGGQVTANFGATTFAYTPPSGFSGFDSPPSAVTPNWGWLTFFGWW